MKKMKENENDLKELVEKLREEDNVLCEKIIRLQDFITSQRIFTVSETQTFLLQIQFQTMKTYHEVLYCRILDLNNQIYKFGEYNEI